MGALLSSAVLAAPAFAQERPKFLDVTIVQVGPEKRAEFNSLVGKAVDANRRGNGDHWIAYRPVYGDGGSIEFISPRSSYADVERSYMSFERALKEAFGAAAEKIGSDFDACLERSRSELRAARWDLSRNVPEDIDALHRKIGSARWVRTATVDVKRSRLADFEARLPEFLDAMHKAVPEHMTLASQTAIGGEGEAVRFYFASFFPSMADMDRLPSMRDTMGDALYRKFQEMNAEDVARVTTEIARPVPELSNPPEFIVNVSRDFWMPKPAVTAARRARPAAQRLKKTP